MINEQIGQIKHHVESAASKFQAHSQGQGQCPVFHGGSVGRLVVDLQEEYGYKGLERAGRI